MQNLVERCLNVLCGWSPGLHPHHTTKHTEYASRLNTYNAARSIFQAPNTHTQPGEVKYEHTY